MDSNPNNYVIMIETKDNVFKVLTNKLNVREAREKLEVVNIALASAESKVALASAKDGDENNTLGGHRSDILRAFIYNLDALKTEGEA